MANGFSAYFDSFEVKGDKITIHKSFIDLAKKRIKNSNDPFGSADREQGQLDILEDLLDAINTGMCIERNKVIKRERKNDYDFAIHLSCRYHCSTIDDTMYGMAQDG